MTKGTGKSAGGSPLRRFFALSRQETCRKSCKLHALHKKNVKRLHGNDKALFCTVTTGNLQEILQITCFAQKECETSPRKRQKATLKFVQFFFAF
nr:MAG TPA: hypothetical protein [Caudoviricetes sp.]